MQRKLILPTVAILMLVSAAYVGAADKPKGPTTRPAATQPAAGKPINKFCAVESDNKIDPKITYVYKGKTIGFCCKDCIEDFQKDPDRYMRGLK